MRNLVTIQTVKDVEPIPGKDRIVLASFVSVGWKVIVGVDTKPGDKMVYCEPDTVLPVRPEFEFLRSRCYNEKWNGFRIKQMKMAGVMSYGLAIPIKDVPGVSEKFCNGKDLTTEIGAIKYDPELLEEQKEGSKKKYNFLLRILFHIPAFKEWYFHRNKAYWPKFVSKTDETRVQTLQYVFNDLQNKMVFITEKVDGQSATFALKDGLFYVCSRNLCITKDKIRSLKRYAQQQSKYLETAKKFDIAAKLKKYKKDTGHDIYIQGEQMGPGIQGNKYGFDSLRFFVFNVFDITSGVYLNGNDTRNFCQEYGFDMVPFVYEGQFTWKTTEELLEFTKGNSKLYPIPREGIVIRSQKTLPPASGMSLQYSFKAINPDFLIKYNLE